MGDKTFLKLFDKKPSVGEVVTISGFNQKRPANPDIMDLDDLFNVIEEGLVQVDDGDQRYFNEFETKTTICSMMFLWVRHQYHNL